MHRIIAVVALTFGLTVGLATLGCGGTSNTAQESETSSSASTHASGPQTSDNGSTGGTSGGAGNTGSGIVTPLEGYVSSRSTNSISVLETTTNTVIDTIALGASGMSNPGSLALSPNKATLYVAMESPALGQAGIVAIDTASHNLLGWATDPTGFPHDIVVHPTQNKAYVCSFNNGGNGKIRVLDTSTLTFTTSIGLDFCNRLAIRPDGAFLYAARSNYAGDVRVYDTTTLALSTTFAVTVPGAAGVNVTDVAVSPDGTTGYILVNTMDTDPSSAATIVGVNLARMFDPQTNTQGALVTVGQRPLAVTFSADSQRAFVTSQTPPTLTIVNTATLTSTSVATGALPTGVAVTPDGLQTYVACQATTEITQVTNSTLVPSTISVGNQPTDVVM